MKHSGRTPAYGGRASLPFASPVGPARTSHADPQHDRLRFRRTRHRHGARSAANCARSTIASSKSACACPTSCARWNRRCANASRARISRGKLDLAHAPARAGRRRRACRSTTRVVEQPRRPRAATCDARFPACASISPNCCSFPACCRIARDRCRGAAGRRAGAARRGARRFRRRARTRRRASWPR